MITSVAPTAPFIAYLTFQMQIFTHIRSLKLVKITCLTKNIWPSSKFIANLSFKFLPVSNYSMTRFKTGIDVIRTSRVHPLYNNTYI